MNLQKYYGDEHGPENQKFAVLVKDHKQKTRMMNPSTHEEDSVIQSGYLVQIAKGHGWDRTNGPKIIWEKFTTGSHEAVAKIVEEAENEVGKLQVEATPKVNKVKETLTGMGFL